MERLEQEIRKGVTDKDGVLKNDFSMAQCGKIAKQDPVILDAGERDLIRLSTQTNHFFLSLGALSVLSERFPSRGFETAVLVAVRPDGLVPLFAQPVLWPAITNEVTQATFNDTLTKLMQLNDVSKDRLFLLLKVLRYEQLWAWFDQMEPKWTNLSAESAVLDQLWWESESSGRPITDKMKQRLRFYSSVPGTPQISYLHHADVSDPRFRQTLISALEDEATVSSTQIRIVVDSRADFILKEVQINELHTSEKRKEFIKDALDRARPIKTRSKT